MSLDVYLEDESGESLYWRNITHNLNKMAGTAGIYEVLWRPEEIGITTAHQLIEPISKGIAFLAMYRDLCEQDNPPNGWGDWQSLYNFCCDYLKACSEHPLAIVRVSR
jgi:hypothetical protein